MANTDNPIPPRCWCGGELGLQIHPLYRRCNECLTLCLVDLPSDAELKRFYSMEFYWHDHQTRELGVPAIEQRAINDFSDRIPVWFNLLMQRRPKVQSVLEIGCAHGGFLHYCQQRGIPHLVGVEVDPATCAYAREHFGLEHVIPGMFPDVTLPIEKFDAIVSFDVLEHLRDPLPALRGITDRLADGGIVILQTPCYAGQSPQWRHFLAPEHVFLFNSASVIQLLRAAGLETMSVTPGYFPEDMFIVARRLPPVRKIVSVRTDSIGDNVLAGATLEHLTRGFPGAEIHLVCQQRVAELYEHCPFVHDVIEFDKDAACDDPAYRGELAKKIRAVGADLALSAIQSRTELSDYLTIATAAAQRIVLYGDLANISAESRTKNDRGFTRVIHSAGEWRTELDRHRDFLRAIGLPAPKLVPKIWTSGEDANAAGEIFTTHGFDPAKTLAIFAGAQAMIRDVDQLGKALASICAELDFRLIALGSPAEAKVNSAVLQSVPGKHLDLSGQTSIRVAAEILRRSRLAVGTETGLAHLACAAGVPNVIILGGGHFGRFMPYSPLTSIVCLPINCYGCNWNCRFERVHCVKDVDPIVIESAIRETLSHQSERPRVFAQDRTLWTAGRNRPQWSWFHAWLDRHEVDVSVVATDEAGRPRVTPLIYPPRHRQQSPPSPQTAQRRAAAYRCLQTTAQNLPTVFQTVAGAMLQSTSMPNVPAAVDEAIILDELLAGLPRGPTDPFALHYRALALLYLRGDETPPWVRENVPLWLAEHHVAQPPRL